MSPTIMMWLYIVFLLASLQLVSSNVCPKNCLCDVERGLNRASCTHQNIINVGVGVSEDVEIYDLNSNSLHQLEDYCFKDLGYTSLIEINLSNNLIFWIGLHALADLDNLEVLDLSNNRLQALAVDLFWYNKKLKYLNLSGNKFLGFSNKPFLSHNKLEVLNLSKSQISFLPELVFSQLPKLKSLDLSKNSMIELQISVLKPLTHLSFLSLAENSWHCNGMFSDLQVWILQKKMEYVTQCKLNEKPKMFEKIISLVPSEDSDRNADKEVNVETLWKIKKKDRDDIPKDDKPITNIFPSFIENFNSKFPSILSLIIGLIVGVLLGMVGTYCWMAELLKCRKIRWKSRRQMRRERAVEHMEDHPLWTTNMRIPANTETPPTARRERPVSNAFCRSESWEGTSFRTEPIPPPRYASRTRSTGAPVTISGSDSPPPPYREYFHDRVINSVPE